MATNIIDLGTVANDDTGTDLRTAGGFINSNLFAWATKAATYTATADDYCIECTATLTIDLPTAVGIEGKRYLIKNKGGTITVTIDPAGTETIDGVTTKTLTVDYSFMEIVSNNTEWSVIGLG